MRDWLTNRATHSDGCEYWPSHSKREGGHHWQTYPDDCTCGLKEARAAFAALAAARLAPQQVEEIKAVVEKWRRDLLDKRRTSDRWRVVGVVLDELQIICESRSPDGDGLPMAKGLGEGMHRSRTQPVVPPPQGDEHARHTLAAESRLKPAAGSEPADSLTQRLAAAEAARTALRQLVEEEIRAHDAGPNAAYCWWCNADINGQNGPVMPHEPTCWRIRAEAACAGDLADRLAREEKK